MSSDLLSYYNRELSLVRRLGGEFARAHPNVAAKLRLNPDTCDDPHVERLIEAFAFLTARIQKSLDDEFSELPTALLNLLYPHYLQPIPSMSVVEFACDAAKAGLTGSYVAGRGQEIESEPVNQTPCTFRTCYPVTIWPIRVAHATISPPQSLPSGIEAPSGAVAMLRLRLESTLPDLPLEKLPVDQLRFFLHGEPQTVNLLYEYLFVETLGVAMAPDARNAPPRWLGPEALRPVGFASDENVLPATGRSAPGYRLLTEYLAFPQKFLFVDFSDLDFDRWSEIGPGVDLYLFLSRSTPDLERNVTSETFRLYCTPVVNLLRVTADPVELTHRSYEYRVSPNARRKQAYEVYTIDRIFDSSDREEFVPFFDIRHRGDSTTKYWYARRRSAAEDGRFGESGSEVYVSFVDLDLKPAEFTSGLVQVETTCLNRDLPTRLPFGGGRPRLTMPRGAGKVTAINCLVAPTPTRRIPDGKPAFWKLFSHLSLNHLSIAGEDGSPVAMQELLKIYDFIQNSSVQVKAEAIRSIRMRHRPFRIGTSLPAAFCRGVEISMELDPDRFSDHGAYLFASVLERFFAFYVSVNSCCRLLATAGQDGRESWRWPPRVGDKPLL